MSRGIMVEQSTAPDAPGTGQITYYFKTDRMLYTKDDSGLETRAGEVKGADVLSASTINLDTATGNLVDVTGSTPITAITLAEGKWSTTRFTGALTLTHGASLVLLANGSNITTVAGDIAQWRGYASGVVRMVSYSRLSGTAITTGITSGTPVASTSGVLIDFTGLPATVKRVTIMFAGVSTNGTSNILVQIGDAGGPELTGYLSLAASIAGAGNTLVASTAGFIITAATAATAVLHGNIVLNLENAAAFTWVHNSTVHNDAGSIQLASGSKSLSAVLTQVRITMVNGTDAFDAGEINILYES